MRQAEQYLRNAENCADLAETARDQPTRARYKRMAEAWLALAREQDWLDGKIPPINIAVNGAQKRRLGEAALNVGQTYGAKRTYARKMAWATRQKRKNSVLSRASPFGR
jgi:hypothetical protein